MRPKPATRCARADLHAVEREVVEAGEHLRFRMTRADSAARAFASSGTAAVPISITRAPSSGSPSLRSSSISDDARIGQNVLGVQRELRQQQQRRAVVAVATLTSEQ